MKRTLALILAIVMVFALAIPAMAATQNNSDGERYKGVIDIDETVKGSNYYIYKMFDLESYDTEKNAYSYKIVDAWSGFFAEGQVGADYATIDSQGYVKWIAADDADIQAFAQAALKFAKENSIAPTDSKLAEKDSVGFKDLDLGYYLVNSGVGSLCALTTTDWSVQITAKNTEPTIKKEVKVSGDQYKSTKSASVGDTVEFKATILAGNGAKNYVMHDQMTEGLTFNKESVAVTLKQGTKNAVTVDKANYTVVTEGLEDECTFEVVFADAFCKTLDEESVITVNYSAVINEAASVYDPNTNIAHLQYGDDNKTTKESYTNIYTYAFNVVKTDKTNKLLDGASFRLYDAKEGGNEIYVKWDAANNRYVVTKDASKAVDIEAGIARVEGIAAGTYYLEEVQEPDGYNKLAERVEFKLQMSQVEPRIMGDVFVPLEGTGVQVINYSGTELPETGGIGTTIFYIVGGLLVIGAAVVLVSKKRMSAE